MHKIVNGEEVPLTPEEIAELQAYTPPPPDPVPLSLRQVACARLMVDADAWEVSGVERSQGISAAFMVDVDTVWVLFNEPMPDTDYMVLPDTGVTKNADFIEVRRPGLAEISFIVQRVQ